jgi:hypothetical protein
VPLELGLLLLLVPWAGAQEGWEDFGPGEPVTVYLKSGKSLEGSVEEITEESLKLELRFGSVTLPREKVARLEPPTPPDDPGSAEATPAVVEPLEVQYSGGKTWRGVPGTRVDIQERRQGGSVKTYEGWTIEGVEEGDLLIDRSGGKFSIPLDSVIEITTVEVPGSPESPTGEPGTQNFEVGPADEWPPEVGSRIRLLPRGDTLFITGEVAAVDGEQLTIDTLAMGSLVFAQKELETWQVVGTVISHLTLARLIRYYGVEINPAWAGKFLVADRARMEEAQLSTIRVDPDPWFRIASLPIEPATGGKETFETRLLRRTYEFHRQRHLRVAELELAYFLERDLIERPEEAERIFETLKRSKAGDDAGVNFATIGTLIGNRLQELAREIRALELQRISSDTIDARNAELEVHRAAHRRYADAIRSFVLFQGLAGLPDLELAAAIKQQGNRVFRQFDDQLTATASGGTLRDQIQSWELVRSCVAVFELRDAGREQLVQFLDELYGGAIRVPYADEEWLFNRKLRHIPATMLPSSSAFRLEGDRGHVGVYHLNVYRCGGQEICRMAIFRIEPGLHVRILFHNQRLLFSEAEEWVW